MLTLTYFDVWRTLIHHSSMVGANELAFDDVSCRCVYGITINLPIAIDHITFAREVFILGMDVECVRLRIYGTKFATKIFTIYPKAKLVSVGRVVSNTVVDVVIGDAGACAERNLTTIVDDDARRWSGRCEAPSNE